MLLLEAMFTLLAEKKGDVWLAAHNSLLKKIHLWVSPWEWSLTHKSNGVFFRFTSLYKNVINTYMVLLKIAKCGFLITRNLCRVHRNICELFWFVGELFFTFLLNKKYLYVRVIFKLVKKSVTLCFGYSSEASWSGSTANTDLHSCTLLWWNHVAC